MNYFYTSFIISTVIYIFLILNFFILLNVLDTRYIKNLSDIKKFGVLFPFNFLFLILLLSFAGVPPLLGFSIKLISFIFVLKGGFLFIVGILSLFNFFTLYFYIQNVRYVVNTKSNNYYIYINHYVFLSDKMLYYLTYMFLLNLIGIVYLSDFFILISSLCL